MSKRKRKKKVRKKKLLDGHKRVGKKFIPPMMQLPMSTSISYVNDMLPELVWIGLLNDKVGYVPAARAIEKVFLAVEDIKDNEQHGNFALISSFNVLSDEQKISLNEKLAQEGVLELLQDSVAPLLLLYDNCPISFLGPPSTVYTNDQLVAAIKDGVGRVIDKYDTPGIVLNGAILISRLVTKKIHFSSEMDLPDFNSVIDSPDSDKAKHAAGFMRASALSEFGMLEVDTTWAREFWNNNIKISSCEFPTEEKDSGR